jgi:predicted TPR repeat methyltransferase
MQRLLMQALKLQQSGRHEQALQLCGQLLARQPDHPDLLNLGGVAAFHCGRQELGLTLLARAVAVSPGSPQAHNNYGNLLQASGELEAARASFERALRLQPSFAQAHKNLGNVLLLLDDLPGCVAAYRRALAITPHDAELHDYLGTALSSLGDLEAALASLRQAIALRPDYAKAYNNLAAVLQQTGDMEAAVSACRRAVALKPGYAKAHLNLGCLLQELRRYPEAADSYRRSLALEPANPEAAFNLGLTLQELGDEEGAMAAYRRALDSDPRQTGARHMLDALTGRTTEIAPGPYIRKMFDNFARTFEHHLVEVLRYRAPEALRAAVDAALADQPDRRFTRMLDLGCGTGLVARRFRDIVDRAEGVDLSPNMVREARDSGLYESVHEATLTDFLAGRRGGAPGFDLVTSADVFIYIGALETLFIDVAAVMSPGGLFVFSVELSRSHDYELRSSGRYAQSEPYIARLALQSGLEVVGREPLVIRQEAGEAVEGLVWVLSKPEAD